MTLKDFTRFPFTGLGPAGYRFIRERLILFKNILSVNNIIECGDIP